MPHNYNLRSRVTYDPGNDFSVLNFGGPSAGTMVSTSQAVVAGHNIVNQVGRAAAGAAVAYVGSQASYYGSDQWLRDWANDWAGRETPNRNANLLQQASAVSTNVYSWIAERFNRNIERPRGSGRARSFQGRYDPYPFINGNKYARKYKLLL